jgi:hypothetical protein
MRVAPVLLLLLAACTAGEERRSREEEPRERRARIPDDAPAGPWHGIYGHSASRLFRIDPDTYEVTAVGAFEGCDGIIDIAVDGSHRIVAASGKALWSVDPQTAKCAWIANGSFPNSLSFLPAGAFEAGAEALVGYVGARYVRIDASTGRISDLGNLDEPGLESSGDIVSVRGGKTFLTVKGEGCATDCLVEIDAKRGSIVKNWGELGFASVYGVAFWGGHVYGFSDGGSVFEVTFEADRAVARPIAARSQFAFWGAGSTTIAPLDTPFDGAGRALTGDAPPPDVPRAKAL